MVIGIIAHLKAPWYSAYQNYLRKAALTDMLQTFVPIARRFELYYTEHGGVTSCDDGGSNGIPSPNDNTLCLRNERDAGHVVSLTGQREP